MTHLLLLLSLGAFAEEPSFPDVRESLPGGYIDWDSWRMSVSDRSDRTVGAWTDQRIQEQDALDRLGPRLLSLAPGVRVAPGLTAGDLLSAGDELAMRIQEGLSEWRVEETRYFQSGSVEMDATLDLQAWLRPALVHLATSPLPPAGPGEATGLVIDVRGLPFHPCMAPRVVGPEGGVTLFQPSDLTEETVRRGTPVVYVSDPADPRAFARAGQSPLFARAVDIQDDSEIVLNAAEAGLIAAHPDRPSIIAAGRLVIVVDP